MASIISRYQYHFLIMLIGLLWFGLINYLLQLNLQSGVYPDAENYKDAAEMIYHHFSFHFYRPVLIAVYCYEKYQNWSLIFNYNYPIGEGELQLIENHYFNDY